jgi:hypothetical protein
MSSNNLIGGGAAGTNGSTGDKGLEHCDKPMAPALARTDEFLVNGEESNNFIKVEGASAAGWVKASMVARR